MEGWYKFADIIKCKDAILQVWKVKLVFVKSIKKYGML